MEKMIDTVSTIFRKRYGAQLKIERKGEEKRRAPIFLSHWPGPFVYSRTLRQVSFPIFDSRRELQAIATASPVDNQDAVIFDEMAQFLQLTIAEHIELSGIAEGQTETEVAIQKAHADHSKVVDLKTRKRDRQTHFEYKQPEVKKVSDLRPIWIRGENLNFNAHIAFSIHDWVANWAFINAKEIPDLIWQDPNYWQNFPQVTIFIPDLTKLSDNKIERLHENLDRLHELKERRPLIVVTSPLEVSEKLEKLKVRFKHYQANDNVTARAQAHFLLFHHQGGSPFWSHRCDETERLYFLPFSPGPTNIH